MSVIRPRLPEESLAYHATGGQDQALAAAARLTEIRDALVATPAGVDLAARMLADYDSRRPASDLFAILGTARRIRDAVDRLVVIAGGGVGPATRLLAATCCHPFHDQLPRGERGGKPRLSWLDGCSGNDEIQGLLDLVARAGQAGDDLLDRWAVLAVDSPPDDFGHAAILEILLEPLAAAVGGDPERLAARVVSVAAAGGRLATTAARLGCPPACAAASVIDSAEGVFSIAGLLPAAVVGIDVVRLLKGAAAMLRRFAEAPVAENPPLLDAIISRSAALDQGRPGRVFLGGGRWLVELAAWHGHVRPAPASAAALQTCVELGEPRRERLALASGPAADVAPVAPGEPVPAAATRLAVAADPVVGIGLPRLDEHAIGQLLQLLILSATVEQRLRQGV
jgi:hypothetical protein